MSPLNTTLPLCAQFYKWIQAIYYGNLIGVTLSWASIPHKGGFLCLSFF